MAVAAAAPASVAPSPAPKASDDRKAVVPVDASELEKHVLVVDDSSVDRIVITRILRGSRYRVTAVESATRAGAARAGPTPRRQHDHHRLLDARDDRV
jgi:two-component response regulator ARR-A family